MVLIGPAGMSRRGRPVSLETRNPDPQTGVIIMAKVCVEFDCNGTGNGGNVQSYTTTLGDGVSTVYSVSHPLHSSDLFYVLRNLNNGELDTFDVVLDASNPDVAVLTFASAPALNSVQVNLLAASSS